MANLTLTEINEWLQIRYEKVMAGMFDDFYMQANKSPFYKLIQKRTDFDASEVQFPIFWAGRSSASTDFTTAVEQSAVPSVEGDIWQVAGTDLEDEYSVWEFGGKALRLLKQPSAGKHQFFAQLNRTILNSEKNIARRLALKIYRDTEGFIARFNTSATMTNARVNLNNRLYGYCLQQGDAVQFTDTSGTLRSATPLYVKTVEMNLTACWITFENAAGTETAPSTLGAAAGDYIIFDGDNKAGLTGLEAWIPTSVSSGTLYGVVRNTGSIRAKQGSALDCTGKAILLALRELAYYAGDHGDGPDTILLDVDSAFKARQELESLKSYQIQMVSRAAVKSNNQSSSTVGVEGFLVATDKGTVECFPDPYCPPNSAYALNLSAEYSPKLWSIGPIPSPLDDDGRLVHQRDALDAYQGRHGGHSNMVFCGPGSCVRGYNLGV